MTTKWTAPRIRAAKGKQRLAMLTAYEAATARLLDEAGLPLILVGDSLGMAALGYATTLPVTLDQMLHHTAAVVRGNRNAMVIADLPFLTYQISVAQAVESAGRCLKEAGADGVKIEGGAFRAPVVRALVENGIPVLGHIGLLPQSVNAMGGYRVQGRTAEDAAQLVEDARPGRGGGFCPGAGRDAVRGGPTHHRGGQHAHHRDRGRPGLRRPGAGDQRPAGPD